MVGTIYVRLGPAAGVITCTKGGAWVFASALLNRSETTARRLTQRLLLAFPAQKALRVVWDE